MQNRNWLSALGALAIVLAVGAFAFALPKGDKGSGDPAAGAAPKGDTKALEGQPAPDWSFPILGSVKSVKLSELKGNVVLVDYWATWCPPCRASLPNINALANDNELKEKGLRVFALNSKESVEKARKYVDENKFTFTVLMDQNGKFGKEYHVRGIPTTVIVGRDGTIKNVFIGYGDGSDEKLRAAIDEALKEEMPTKPS
jgi:peroxiredoxin